MYPAKNRALDREIRSRVNDAIRLLNEGHPQEARQTALDVLFDGTNVLVEAADLDVLSSIESLLTSLGDTACAAKAAKRRADIVDLPEVCSMVQFSDDYSTVSFQPVRNVPATVLDGQFLVDGNRVYMHGSENAPKAAEMFAELRKFSLEQDRSLRNETRATFNMGHISPSMWHFTFNTLSRLAYLDEEQLRSYEVFTGFGKIRDHQRELIVSMGAPADRLVEFEVDESVRFDNLTQYPCGFYTYYRNITKSQNSLQWDRRLVQTMKSRILANVGIEREEPRQPVFVWRDPKGKRKLVNQKEIVEHLGYMVVDPASSSLAEQAEIMSQASIVVGGFSAGLRMILFAPTAIPVIELKPLGFKHGAYEMIAASLGQRFSSVTGEIVGSPANNWFDLDETNYRVDLADIDEAIRSVSG